MLVINSPWLFLTLAFSYSSTMTPIKGTSHGVRSSLRVAVKKSLKDGILLPHAHSKCSHPISINDDGKSPRNAEGSAPAAAGFFPLRNGPKTPLHPPSPLTHPSFTNDAEVLALDADFHFTARNRSTPLPLPPSQTSPPTPINNVSYSLNSPHRSPVNGNCATGHRFLSGSAALIPQCWDVICADYQYTSKQPGNIKLNNIVLERRAGYKAINSYHRFDKAEIVNQIVLEIELVGRFLSRHGPDQFTIATDQLKKEVVTRRLRRKEKGKKCLLPMRRGHSYCRG